MLKNFLSPEEIAAAKDRLHHIKAYIGKLPSANIIDSGEWGSDRVGGLMADPARNYIARDFG